MSDQTRLGPYSVLLKDAFEESQSQQRLTLNETTLGISETDIVALERSLTPTEIRQGLSQQLVIREKIALIVGDENPFRGTLTLKQVAGIFRGEITNWQQVGGDDRPLELVHRAEQNPIRQALERYGLFDSASFSEGVAEEKDSTTAVVDLLGSSGISYAPASETIEQFTTRVITVDNVGVDDGRYPFSLPLNYVYQANPEPEGLPAEY
ncbi:MAG: substrate-binding domain-containing protein [Cyanobacteria bacterium P01_F01_bin.42]